MTEYKIGEAEELSDGDRIVVQLEGREIAIFKIDGEFYAYTNWCPHQSGPCGEGKLTGTQKATFDQETLEVEFDWCNEGEILNCPWHGWEFDVTTGECLSRGKVKLPSHPVKDRDGEIVLEL